MKRLLAAACLALAACGAHAQVACNVSVAPLGFGVYDTLSPFDNQVNGDVTLDCRLIASNAAHRISYSIAIGTGDSGSFARRTMRAPGRSDRLAYNVFLTRVSPSTIWGDGTGGSVPATGSIIVNKVGGNDIWANFYTLGTIASISPLLGLLGTVTGMIKVFEVVAVQGNSNFSLLSTGIAEALVTTAAGLTVAIPSLLFYRYFQRRIDELVIEIEQETLELIDLLDTEKAERPA